MEIKLGRGTNSLTVTNYDSNDIDKVRFVREIGIDKDIRKFVSPEIENYLMRPTYTDGIESSVAYLVKDKDKIVGFFKPSMYYGTDIGIDYGIHPNYRRCGYGSRMLIEISNYFFERNIKSITLCIDNSNIPSINTAIAAGFKKENVGYQMITEYVKRVR